jgi:hypothetical protein
VEDDAEFTHDPYVVRVYGGNAEELITVGQESVFVKPCLSLLFGRGAGEKAKERNETKSEA